MFSPTKNSRFHKCAIEESASKPFRKREILHLGALTQSKIDKYNQNSSVFYPTLICYSKLINIRYKSITKNSLAKLLIFLCWTVQLNPNKNSIHTLSYRINSENPASNGSLISTTARWAMEHILSAPGWLKNG